MVGKGLAFPRINLYFRGRVRSSGAVFRLKTVVLSVSIDGKMAAEKIIEN